MLVKIVKKKKSIIYWDANNLFGWGMSNPLPYGEFNWLSEKETNKLDLDSVSENSSIGHFLEVDVEYPSKLHDSHNDYPLAPEKLKISSICYLQWYLSLGMRLSKIHRVLKFKQSNWFRRVY